MAGLKAQRIPAGFFILHFALNILPASCFDLPVFSFHYQTIPFQQH